MSGALFTTLQNGVIWCNRPSALALAGKADREWSAELRLVYGNKACDARYDARGTATPNLKRLYQARLVANDLAYGANS